MKSRQIRPKIKNINNFIIQVSDLDKVKKEIEELKNKITNTENKILKEDNPDDENQWVSMKNAQDEQLNKLNHQLSQLEQTEVDNFLLKASNNRRRSGKDNRKIFNDAKEFWGDSASKKKIQDLSHWKGSGYGHFDAKEGICRGNMEIVFLLSEIFQRIQGLI